MTNTRSNAYYINEVIDSGILASLSPAHGQVYTAYVRYSNGGVNDAFPSQEKLSSNLGIDVRTIRRAIRNLTDLGYIKQVSSGKGKGSKKSNLFTVMMPSQLGFPKSATQAPVQTATLIDSLEAEQPVVHNPYILTDEQKLKVSTMIPSQPYYTSELQEYYNSTDNITIYFPNFNDLLDYLRFTSHSRRLDFRPLWKEIRPEIEHHLT